MGLTVHFEVLNQLGTPMMYSSSLATRPAAGIQGRIFFRTDSPYGIYRDNGTSWDQIAGSGGGGLSGSGTATQIAYFSAATTLASSANLFWDNTNGRLGVNTATPGSSLDIHSAVQSVIQANNTTLGNSFLSFQLQGTGKWQIGNVYSAGDNYFRIQDQLNTLERFTIRNTGQIDFLGYTQILNTVTGITGTTPSALPNNYYSNNFTYNSGITTVASVNTIGLDVDNSLNYSGANTINNTSYNTNSLLRNLLTFGSASASITYTQATGIRALCNEQVQYFQSGANSGSISHYANIQILGDNKNGAGLTTFTNRYGILINDFNEFTAGNTYTNRWGIYQAGLNENNFFAGKVGIGSGFAPGTFQLDVVGADARINGLTIGKGNGSLSNNTAIGLLALGSASVGVNNTAIGTQALQNNQGGANVAVGYLALNSNTTGSSNVAVGGFETLQSNTTGSNNVAIGRGALKSVVSGSTNVAIGFNSANANTSSNNIAIGATSFLNNTTGTFNVVVGVSALNAAGAASNNTAIGYQALTANTGDNNLAIGLNAAFTQTTATNNTVIGGSALAFNTTGSQNNSFGRNAGAYITGGTIQNTISNNSIYIGNDTKALADNETNQIVIGYNATGAGSNTVTLGHTTITKTILRGTINAANLPTSSVGLVAGDIWNNLGILNIV